MVSKFSDVAVKKREEDQLGFKDYAVGIIDTIENVSEDDTPFTIAIFGPWGSGKSSLMWIMKDILTSRGYETIFFNSWEYGNEEKPWIPFMIQVVEELFKKEIDRKELIRNIFLFSTDMVLQYYSEGKLSTSSILDLIKKSGKTSPFREWSDEDVNAVIERVTKIREFKEKIEERTKKYLFRWEEIPGNHSDRLTNFLKSNYDVDWVKAAKIAKTDNGRTIMITAGKNFLSLNLNNENTELNLKIDKGKTDKFIVINENDKLYIYEKIAGISPKTKIIIFVDDLDRIPEKLIDFLNSLKTFLDIRGCIFILGCDYKILDNELKNKYTGENIEEIYEDYFDKIVQTEFYIPRISEQAIKGYLRFLTGWSKSEIEECTKLVLNSIGGNPRKIKRAVNATVLIKNVFESKLVTLLQEFERPKQRVKPQSAGKEKTEEPVALRGEITRIFTPVKVFDILFDTKVLFKLVCMRDRWYNLYESILSDEDKQCALALGDAAEILKSTKEEGDALRETEKDLPRFLTSEPSFQRVEDVKTYLDLLGISSPDAGISFEYADPWELPIKLFNRYMIFEHINKGEVKEKTIENKIDKMDCESDLSSYYFFIEVIRAIGYDHLIKRLFENENNLDSIADIKKIRDSKDPGAIGWLLSGVNDIDKGIARGRLIETKDSYADKIRDSNDLGAIGLLLSSVNKIDSDIAGGLLSKTEDAYADKIKDSNNLGAIGWLLSSVNKIDPDIAGGLLNKTEDTYAKKIRDSNDPGAIGLLLSAVSEIDKEKGIAGGLLIETKDTYAKKIRDSNDLGAIGLLLSAVSEIDKEKGIAGGLLIETKDTISEKIRDSNDLGAIGLMLKGVKEIGVGIIGGLLIETKDTISEKIRDSNDPGAIGLLLISVNDIDGGIAEGLLNKTEGTYAGKIKDSNDLGAIGWLLSSVNKIDPGIAGGLLIEAKDNIANKINDSKDPGAIGLLLSSVNKIDPWIAGGLLIEAKDNIAEKIKDSKDPGAIESLLSSVNKIDPGIAKRLLIENDDNIAEKIKDSKDPGAIESLLSSVNKIDPGIAKRLLIETKETIAEKIRDSKDTWATGSLLAIVRTIDGKTARKIEDKINFPG